MLPLTKDDFAPPSVNHCTQSKCKATLPDGYKYKTCEKCRNMCKLSMQRKRKRDRADEGLPHNSHLEEDSDIELTNKVSRFTFRILKELLPNKSSRKMLLSPLRTKMLS